MSTSALLLSYLAHKADYTEYTKMQIYYANKHETLSGQVSRYANLDEKWNEYYDDAVGGDKKIKFNGQEYGGDDNPAMSPALAKMYADSKVPQADENRYEELTELDTDMEALKEVYDTLMTETKAIMESEQQELKTSTQDTGMLNGG